MHVYYSISVLAGNDPFLVEELHTKQKNIHKSTKTGFKLVKQNRFAKKSKCSKEKRPEKRCGFANHFMKNAKSFVN